MSRPVRVPEEAIKRYLDGESPAAVSSSIGCSRIAFVRHMKRNGFPVRGRSDAEYLKNSRRSPEQRKQQAAAAHAAATGRRVSWEQKCARARTVEKSMVHASPNEIALVGLLQDMGASGVVMQKACGAYNIDVAWWPLAIEVYGGGWHGYGQHRQRSRERFGYVTRQGWVPLVVWCHDQTFRRRARTPTAACASFITGLRTRLIAGMEAGRVFSVRYDGGAFESSGVDLGILERVCHTRSAGDS